MRSSDDLVEDTPVENCSVQCRDFPGIPFQKGVLCPLVYTHLRCRETVGSSLNPVLCPGQSMIMDSLILYMECRLVVLDPSLSWSHSKKPLSFPIINLLFLQTVLFLNLVECLSPIGIEFLSFLTESWLT